MIPPIVYSLLAFAVANGVSATNGASLTEPGSHDNSGECQCYIVSGVDPGYFQYYRFWV